MLVAVDAPSSSASACATGAPGSAAPSRTEAHRQSEDMKRANRASGNCVPPARLSRRIELKSGNTPPKPAPLAAQTNTTATRSARQASQHHENVATDRATAPCPKSARSTRALGAAFPRHWTKGPSVQTGTTGEAAVRCVGGEVVLRVQTTTLAIPPLPVAASVLIDKSTSKRLGTQTVLQCMSPLMMLWTAPPPARQCQGCGR